MLTYNLHLIKFTLLSIQFCELWQMHAVGHHHPKTQNRPSPPSSFPLRYSQALPPTSSPANPDLLSVPTALPFPESHGNCPRLTWFCLPSLGMLHLVFSHALFPRIYEYVILVFGSFLLPGNVLYRQFVYPFSSWGLLVPSQFLVVINIHLHTGFCVMINFHFT